ncbi:MAG TPA: DUF4878 domain-containing protein, partial [Chitinophagaceae bacterium]|nr:DUF4878 domain-containing protein [Chitinophagaceae bacterium]
MRQTVTFFVAAAAMMLAITGCKGKGAVADDPKAVVMAFFERMANKDIDGAAKLATKDSKAALDMMKKGMDMAEKFKDMKTTEKDDDPAEEFASMEFGETKVDGDNATVSVYNKKKDDNFDFPLKREDGSWKVDFSMKTLMKMGMDKANEKRMNGTDENDEDEMNDAMEKMKNFSLDSLQKGLKMVDS